MDWASITENSRGYGANIPKTQRIPGVDGGLIYQYWKGSFAKRASRRGILQFWPQDHEPIAWIRSAAARTGMQREPHDLKGTVQILLSQSH